MTFFSKNTQTLIVSLISSILFVITPNITQSQVLAYDPLSVPNNKFGIHLISATPDESSPAASLVNSSGGDWGYITVLIEQKDKNKGKWQEFFNDLRRRHLIPIVRIATEPEGNNWKIPNLEDVQSWADFLDSLNWPIKNRYVVIFNEPNQAHEWGGTIDPKMYTEILDKFITTLKFKNRDFFVLNAGLDASAPSKLPNYQDEIIFMKQMNDSVPGIFDRLDGWVSHSYPNPGFAGSPDGFGRGSVRTWYWEIQQLRNLGVTKNFPIFITETGWKHAEGVTTDFTLPGAETVGQYFEQAFNNAWNASNIVAVTPFLLSYQEKLFDHFSFKKLNSSEYYPQFQTIASLPKTIGKPIQENKAQLVKGEIYSSIVADENYQISLTFKNIGQSIWGDGDLIKLVALTGGSELGIENVEILKNVLVAPGQEYTFYINLKAPEKGSFNISLNLFSGSTQFESNPVKFQTEVKLPVILQILGKLKWKNSPEGDYVLKVAGIVGDSSQNITLDPSGRSNQIEAKYLLPDYNFEFSLEKPFYHPITIHRQVKPGLNVLDFGTLQPALLPALLHPKELWQLLPFSN